MNVGEAIRIREVTFLHVPVRNSVLSVYVARAAATVQVGNPVTKSIPPCATNRNGATRGVHAW